MFLYSRSRTTSKTRTAVFLVALCMSASGHMFFLASAQIAEASIFEQTSPAHHDVIPHDGEDGHVSCPNDLHQFSYHRSQDISPDTNDVIFDVPQSSAITSSYPPGALASATRIQDLPPRLPLAQKTQFLF